MRKEKIKKIAEFAKEYEMENLSEKSFMEHFINVGELSDDWWEALKFFFSRTFYQGRRDNVSLRVERETVDVLARYFNDPVKRERNFVWLKQRDWSELRKALEEKIGKGKIGRERDIEMVICTLRFISKLQDKNIVNYSVRMVEKGKLEELWKRLQRSKSEDGIISVGEKVSSLYLRDLVALLNLESYVPAEQQEFLQPIDTWVRKLCGMLGIKGTDQELRREIVKRCNALDVSPIKFNMGAWYMSTHALYILYKLL